MQILQKFLPDIMHDCFPKILARAHVLFFERILALAYLKFSQGRRVF